MKSQLNYYIIFKHAVSSKQPFRYRLWCLSLSCSSQEFFSFFNHYPYFLNTATSLIDEDTILGGRGTRGPHCVSFF